MALVNDLTCPLTSLGRTESWHVACGAHPSGWGDDADPDPATTALLVMGQARLRIRRRRSMAVNPIQIQKFLKGVDYPASKEDVLANAERNGADEDVRTTLDQLPDEEYETPADVSQALGNIG
jgi:hypothetical protein